MGWSLWLLFFFQFIVGRKVFSAPLGSYQNCLLYQLLTWREVVGGFGERGEYCVWTLNLRDNPTEMPSVLSHLHLWYFEPGHCQNAYTGWRTGWIGRIDEGITHEKKKKESEACLGSPAVKKVIIFVGGGRERERESKLPDGWITLTGRLALLTAFF